LHLFDYSTTADLLEKTILMAADNIYIIGSGAIGRSLAVFLQQEKKQVTLLRGSVDDRSSRKETMSVVVDGDKLLEEEIEVSTVSNFAKLDGIVVLTTKSFGNSALSNTLKSKVGNSPLVILQNGLGVEQPFVESGFESVYRCVLFVTSQRMSSDQVRFKPVSVCPVGIIKGNAQELERITTTLSSQHFQFAPEISIQPVIWKKAIVNCAFNSICPLLGADNGIFHRNPSALKIASDVIHECVSVAAGMGIMLDEAEVVRSLLMISKMSDGQLISTLQDINNGRRTEIDTLNVEVVRLAQSLGMNDAVLTTGLLGQLTKLKEGEKVKM
jgi:2-dehydropantoate 2-reductase